MFCLNTNSRRMKRKLNIFPVALNPLLLDKQHSLVVLFLDRTLTVYIVCVQQEVTHTNIPDKIPWAIFSLHPGSGSFSFSSVATVTPVPSFGRPRATFSLRLITSDPVPSEPCQRNHMLHSYYERTLSKILLKCMYTQTGYIPVCYDSTGSECFYPQYKNYFVPPEVPREKSDKHCFNKHHNFITNELLVSTKTAAQTFLRHKKKIAK